MTAERSVDPDVLPDDYRITWASPSRDSVDAMPLPGECGAGATVWVQDGSLWLYLGHSGAFDESGTLLKLGCLRLTPADGDTLVGDMFADDMEQTYDPVTGSITVNCAGQRLTLWFAEQNLVIETEGNPIRWSVDCATWRDRVWTDINVDRGRASTLSPDVVETNEKGWLIAHRNDERADVLTARAVNQGLTAAHLGDFASERVFGFAAASRVELESAPMPRPVSWQNWSGTTWTATTRVSPDHQFVVALRAERIGDPRAWPAQARELLGASALEGARARARARWADWWSRSRIVINPGAGEQDEGWLVGRNYHLFRSMLATNQGAEIPLLFNGGIMCGDFFPGRITGNTSMQVVFQPESEVTPDFRSWSFVGFMSQNQRWLAWPALAAGDTELVETYLTFYRERAQVAAARAANLGAEGHLYLEPMDLWGLCTVDPGADGLSERPHLRYHFSIMVEAAWIALQARDVLGVNLDEHWNWIAGTVLFYDSFYRRLERELTGEDYDQWGRLLIHPSSASESYLDATNPAEVVAGLRRLTERLSHEESLPEEVRERLRTVGEHLPDLPYGIRRGRTSVLPAESWEAEQNPWEAVELAAAWPYRLIGVCAPGTEDLADATWDSMDPDRLAKQYIDYSWQPTVANLAALGRVEEAQRAVVKKLANVDAPQARFPAFFGPGHDWLPDHNWGGSGMTGLQEMLLAPEPGPAGALHLFPAWPSEWDVDFRLHAPGETIIEGSLRAGQLCELSVTPTAREDDVVLHLGSARE